MTSLSAEQVLARNTEAMGAELGPVFTALTNELVWLHMRWANYLALFGASPSRVELVNRAAGTFFHIIQVVMWNDLLLGVARVTDPPRTGGRDNLTVQRLPALVTGTPIDGAIRTQLDAVLTGADFARDWRNRHLAHRDLARAIAGKEAEPLASASVAAVRECLSLIAALLNIIDNHYLESTMFYDMDYAPGDAQSLLGVLRHGLDAKDAYLERLRAGLATHEEMERFRSAV